MLDINCNRDTKNYVSSDHILRMFTLLNVDFETMLHGEQKIVLLSYTCVKNWHDIILNWQPPDMVHGMSEPLMLDKWH